MIKILVASNNSHKITEINYALKDIPNVKIHSLKDFGIKTEVIENGETLEANAFKKAKEIYDVLKIPALSDDTGLFADALNGEPGVYSARYAGDTASYYDNCIKLLSNLKNTPFENRTAAFETVICFYVNNYKHYFFKGICRGIISNVLKGKNGFGYDPVFIPEGYNISFAEMSEEEKNKISHRALALNNFREFVRNLL